MSAVFQAMKETTASSLHLFRRVDCRMDIQLIFFQKLSIYQITTKIEDRGI